MGRFDAVTVPFATIGPALYKPAGAGARGGRCGFGAKGGAGVATRGPGVALDAVAAVPAFRTPWRPLPVVADAARTRRLHRIAGSRSGGLGSAARALRLLRVQLLMS